MRTGPTPRLLRLSVILLAIAAARMSRAQFGPTTTTSTTTTTTSPSRPCEVDAECNGQNPCTIDRCIQGSCQPVPVPDGTTCDDGNRCNGADACRAGTCTPLGSQRQPCAASTLGAFVGSFRTNSVSVLDVGKGKVVSTLAVGRGPWGIAASPDGQEIFVSNRLDGTVSVIETAGGGRVAATVGVGESPVGIVVHPEGLKVYVANLKSGTVSVIDRETRAVEATIRVGRGPAAAAVNPQGTRLYVTNYRADTVSVVDTTTNVVVVTVKMPGAPLGVAVDPTGARVYVADYLGGRVSIIGTASNTVLGHIAVGSRPFGVAVDPTGSRVYVTNTHGGSVSVIDAVSSQVVATVPVGRFPFGLTIDPVGRVLVVNARDGTASLIDPTTLVARVVSSVGEIPVSLGQFLATDPSVCPSPALVCDDADPSTVDTCSPSAGCQHTPLTGLDAARASADALAATYRTGPVGTGSVASRLATLINDAATAIAGGSPTELARASRAVRKVTRILEGSVRPSEVAPQVASRLLDLARATAQRLRELRSSLHERTKRTDDQRARLSEEARARREPEAQSHLLARIREFFRLS